MFHLCSLLSSHDSAAHLRNERPRRRRRAQSECAGAMQLRPFGDPRQHRPLGHLSTAGMDRRHSCRRDATALLRLQGGGAPETPPEGRAGAAGADGQASLVRYDRIQASRATSQMTFAVAVERASNLPWARRTDISTGKNDHTPPLFTGGPSTGKKSATRCQGERKPQMPIARPTIDQISRNQNSAINRQPRNFVNVGRPRRDNEAPCR